MTRNGISAGPEAGLSPNHGSRRGVTAPDMVVLHYTAMESAAAARARLCDSAAEVSAHYLIDGDGSVDALVPEECRAWHAGVARWGAVADVNSHSIGVELANPGPLDGLPPFPEAQMAALEAVLTRCLDRWSIPPERVVGHACVSPGRKIDPGPRFDWRRLAQRGLSVWLDPNGTQEQPTALAFQDCARAFGYGLDVSTVWDAETLAVWEAFRLRFRPYDLDPQPGPAAMAHLRRLAERWPVAASSPP